MIIFTGGGTGGHIFPAIEIAKMAREGGVELCYFGSLRGQESGICQRENIPFQGFHSEPIYSFRTWKGATSTAKMLRASRECQREMKRIRPSAIFSTGGYAAAPVMMAAKHLGIPTVIHESNSIPGRSNRLFAKSAFAFTSVFNKTKEVIPWTVRTGQPIRRELRELAKNLHKIDQGVEQILITSGSQGSEYLNKTVLSAIELLPADIRYVHVTGAGHYDDISSKKVHGNHSVVGYLQSDEMAKAYSESSLVIARSGGTLAEIAMFRLPSILIPLPTAADDHQDYNAQEFEKMGAAIRIDQKNASANAIANAVHLWINDGAKRESARNNLIQWDIPNSNEQVWNIVQKAIASKP